MKTRTVISMLVALTLIFSLGACNTGNPYMKRGSDKFESFTSNLLGEWSIASYSLKGTEKIGSTYKSCKVIFDEPEQGHSRGRAVFTLPLSAATIKTMSAEWKKKWPELKVESYKIIISTDWQISKDGRVLIFDNPLVSADITGKGKGIKEIIGWENGKLQTASIAQSRGGREDFVFGKIVQSTSGVSSYYPELPPQSRFKLTGKSLETTSNFRINLSMKR